MKREIVVDGTAYELSESNDDEMCQYCAFSNAEKCPKKCKGGFWIEKPKRRVCQNEKPS